MALIDIRSFTGMLPAVAGHLLEPNEAQLVLGAELSSGELRHVNRNLRVTSFTSETHSVWLQDCRALGKGEHWLRYADRRSFVSANVDDAYARVYMSKEDGGLAVSAMQEGELHEYKLGVPAPEVAPAIGSTGKREGDVSFSKATSLFTFTSALKPFLAPGQKVVFTGSSLPTGISADTVYIILFEDNGGYAFAKTETPTTAVVLDNDGSGHAVVQPDGLEQTRLYAFTAVNSFGEESAPGPLSASLTVDASCRVELSGMAFTMPEGFAPLAAKRVYRAATGTKGETGLLFLAEIPAAETSWTDISIDLELGESCMTTGWNPPPALRNLRGMPDGVLVGHTDTEVCFSEPGHPYAWPSAQRYSVRGRIEAVAVSMRTVFVLTDSVVHVVTMDDPAMATITTLNGYVPCLNAAGVVESSLGVFFPSTDGLYRIGEGYSQAQNVTDGLINEREWRPMSPETMLSAFFDMTYFAFIEHDTLGKLTLLLDFGSDGQARMRYLQFHGSALTLVPSRRRLFCISPRKTGNGLEHALYQVFGDTSETSPITWTSKCWLMPYPVNMAACIVETQDKVWDTRLESWNGTIGAGGCAEVPFGGEQTDAYPWEANLTMLALTCDGRLVARIPVTPYALLPLPGDSSGRRFEVQITSFAKDIRRVAVATTTAELMG